MPAKKVTLVVAECPDRVGAMQALLAPIAKAKVNLLGAVGYSVGGGKAQAVCVPDCVDTVLALAKEAGVKAKTVDGVMVSGKDAPGVGARLTKRVADAGINVKGMAALAGKKMYLTLIWAAPKDAAKLAKVLNAK